MTTRLAAVPALASVSVLAAGCFGNGGSLLSLPSGLGEAAPAGGARFAINGTIILVSGSSYVVFSGGPEPDANFTSMTGCDSRRFLADYSDNVKMLFGYTASGAHLLMGNQIYDWTEPPEVVGAELRWTGDFDPAGGNSVQSIEVDVGCPLPVST